MKALICAIFALAVTTQLTAQNPEYLPGRVIVQFDDAQYPTAKFGPIYREVEFLMQTMGASPAKPMVSAALQEAMVQRLPVGKRRAGTLATMMEMNRTYQYDYIGNMDARLLAHKLSQLPGVTWAEPVYARETDDVPNDVLVGQPGQDYFEAQGFYAAWNISKSSRNVVIAIVDNGTDYTHPDLRSKLWVNYNEIPAGIRGVMDTNADQRISGDELHAWAVANVQDYNADGLINVRDALRAESPLTDGVDNDQNDYIDDIVGWDYWESGYGSAFVEDNDPYDTYNQHGTHVAGIAAASTNNGIGIAGTGYDALIMPIKVGGSKETNTIYYGYQGIIYAALMGADVINNSWSGLIPTQWERSVVRWAYMMGSVVVAASGNKGIFINSFPASYPEVLSVGSSDYVGVSFGHKTGFSTYNYEVDVLATGNRTTGGANWGIVSTYRSNINDPSSYTYTQLQGTSMAAPVVSGLAALVRDYYGSWEPEQIASQIRVTSTMADAMNDAELSGKLGHGTINALKALSSALPGYTVIDHAFVNGEGEKAFTNEPAFIEYEIVNYGAARPANMTLSTTSTGVSLQSTNQSINLSAWDTVTVRFPIIVGEMLDMPPVLKLEFRNNTVSYYDFDIIELDEVMYDYVYSEQYEVQLNSYGNIGAIDAIYGIANYGYWINLEKAFGDWYEVLYEGGLMVGSKGKLADRLRIRDDSTAIGIVPRTAYRGRWEEAGEDWLFKSEGLAQLHLYDKTGKGEPDTSLSMKIEGMSYYYGEDINKVAFLKYTIRNNSKTEVAESTYVGIFTDWGILSWDRNSVAYSAEDSILYAYDGSRQSTSPYVAVVPLGDVSTAFAIKNSNTGTGLDYGLYDAHTAAEKMKSLKAGKSVTSFENTDVASVSATGPYHIEPNGYIVVGFALAYGYNLDELKAQVARARALHLIDVSRTGIITSNEEAKPNLPISTKITGNYPNPFNPTTTLEYELSESGNITMVVYNLVGQRVAKVIDGFKTSGRHQVTVDAYTLGSGVYFVRMTTSKGSHVHKMMLIK
jgi:serine protease